MTDIGERQNLQSESNDGDPQDAALVRIAGGFAHNFNNLLTVIAGNVQLVEMRLHDEALKSLLREAALACAMGARMTERLLTYAHQRRLAPAPCDVVSILRSLDGVIRHAVGPNVRVVTNCENAVFPVTLDQSEFESAVLNIVFNARDAMPNGGVLTIAAKALAIGSAPAELPSRLPPGRYVALTLNDTGVGMTPYVLNRACEPFFSTKAPDRGTGLGLATVQGFVEQSGGAIEINSAPDLGTRVTLYFPAWVSETTATKQSA